MQSTHRPERRAPKGSAKAQCPTRTVQITVPQEGKAEHSLRGAGLSPVPQGTTPPLQPWKKTVFGCRTNCYRSKISDEKILRIFVQNSKC